MTTFGARRALWSPAALAGALLLTALGSPTAAQIAADDAVEIDQIQEIISRDGPYSLALLEPLTRLGLNYRESEDHTLALVTLERAVHIVRVNKGLHSLEQVPLVRQLIAIEEARGNAAGAWEREQGLLTLVRRHPEDIRAVPVLREIADKQMEMLGAVLAGKRPPQVVLGCFYKQWPSLDEGSCTAGSKRNVVQGMLAEAQRNYADAIRVMLRNGLYDSDELRALELEVLRGVDLVRSIYYRGRSSPLPMVPGVLAAESLEPWRSRIAPVAELADWDLPYPSEQVLESGGNGGGIARHVQLMDPYYRGKQSLRRLYAYGAAGSSDSLLQQADAVVQLADWDLLYSHNGLAVNRYAAAYDMLAEADVPPGSIDELFAPETPVVLPAFQPNPLAPDDERPATGHIDVAFEITKYGRGRSIVILGDEHASDDAKQRLQTLIKYNRFRPRVMDGKVVEAAPVSVRYYLYEHG
jgi:hypothetical protein